MTSKLLHELMGIMKYGSDNDRDVLLKALLQEKKRRESQTTKQTRSKAE